MQKIFSFSLSLIISFSMVLPDVALALRIANDPDQNLQQIDGGAGGGGGSTTTGSSSNGSSGSSAGGSSGGSSSGGSSGGQQFTCTPENMILPQPQGNYCCDSLKLDANRKCIKDPSAYDHSLVVCDPNQPNTCTNNRSCLPQTAESFFKYAAVNEQDSVRLSADEATVDSDSDPADPADNNDVGRPKVNGQLCVQNSDCVSYNCIAPEGSSEYKCQPKHICRYGEEDEAVAVGVTCDEGLNNINGKCEPDPNPDLPPYLDIMAPGSVEATISNSCQLKENASKHSEGQRALNTMRAVEWLMINLNASDDCMLINKFLREKVKVLLNEKKTILRNFNILMAHVEQDQLQLMASVEDRQRMLTMEGIPINSFDLATRRQSGYDMLRLMIRKNNIYKSYEYEMSTLADKMSKQMAKLGVDMMSWKSHKSKTWTLDGVTYKGKHNRCRGGGFLNLGRRKIYKRWNKKMIIVEHPINKQTVDRVDVMDALKRISQGTDQDVKNKLFSKNVFHGLKGYYQMDPLIDLTKPGLAANFQQINLPFNNTYGAYGNSTSTGIMSMANFRDVRAAIRLDIIDYLKKLEMPLTPEVQPLPPATQEFVTESLKQREIKFETGFIVEPELAPIESRKCFGLAPNAPVPVECGKFNQAIDTIADHAFASFLAWSVHHRKNYKFYFGSGETWRNRLMQHWESQLFNATKYYVAKIELRDQQNECIDKAIRHIEGNLLDGAGSGIAEGGGNYYEAGNYNAPTNGGPPRTQVTNFTPGKPLPYAFDLSLSAFTMQTAAINKDSIGATRGPSAANMANLNAGLASRYKKFQEHNDSLAKKGVNIADKQKAYNDATKSVNSAAGAAGAGGSGASSADAGKMNMASYGGNAVNVKPTDKKDAKDGLGEGVKADGRASSVVGAPGAGAAGMGGMNGMGTSPFGSSSDPNAANQNGKYQDPTGMSDDEKDVVLKNIERNQSKYSPNEGDDLFTIISKKYANSLHLILTKKKQLEE